MLKLNLQLFAHKKGMGSTKNGRDSESKRLGAKRADGQFVLAGNILTAREELIFILATMLVSAQTILFMLLLTAPLDLKKWVRTAKRFPSIPLSSN